MKSCGTFFGGLSQILLLIVLVTHMSDSSSTEKNDTIIEKIQQLNDSITTTIVEINKITDNINTVYYDLKENGANLLEVYRDNYLTSCEQLLVRCKELSMNNCLVQKNLFTDLCLHYQTIYKRSAAYSYVNASSSVSEIKNNSSRLYEKTALLTQRYKNCTHLKEKSCFLELELNLNGTILETRAQLNEAEETSNREYSFCKKSIESAGNDSLVAYRAEADILFEEMEKNIFAFVQMKTLHPAVNWKEIEDSGASSLNFYCLSKALLFFLLFVFCRT